QLDTGSFRLITELRRASACDITLERYYEVSDLCGNTDTCMRRIIIIPDLEDAITCPNDLEFECKEDIPEPYSNFKEFIEASSTDPNNIGDIDTASFRFIDEISDDMTCPETIVRTYEVNNICGTVFTCRQNIVINDVTAPQISCPPDVFLLPIVPLPPAFTDVEEFINSGGSVSDNCAIDSSSFALVASDTVVDASITTITNTYSISDLCGNTDQCQQTIKAITTVETEISCPPTIHLECYGYLPDPYTTLGEFISAGGSAYSNCDLNENSFILVSETTDKQICPETITRIYQVTDYCGNPIECTQYILTHDTIPPEFITTPGDIYADCELPDAYADYSEFTDAGGQADDNCELDTSSFTLISETVIDSVCPLIVSRIYQISDICGNSDIYNQLLIVNDTIPPVFISLPDNIEEECSSSGPYNSYAEFIADGGNVSDNCGIDTSSFRLVEEINTGQHCPSVLYRTYSINDYCGNTSNFVQTVIASDLTGPVFDNVPTLYAECEVPEDYKNYDEFVADGGIITDNCGFDESTFKLQSEMIVSENCPRQLRRNYSITDFCGNESTYEQMVEINDTIAPHVIIPPADISIECVMPETFKDLDSYVSAGAIVVDNCIIDSSSFRLVSELRSGHCPTIITRLYEVSDVCGNAAQLIHTIIAYDFTPPEISCPPPITIQPEEPLPLPYQSVEEFINAGGTISDNCGIVDSSLIVISEISDNNTCPETIIRTYEISDSCNNKSTCEQAIIIWDTTPPEITCPESITVECMDDIPQAYSSVNEFISAGGIIADNFAYDENSFRMNNETDDGNHCPKIVTRTYQIADLCNNISECIQYITVDDITDPILVCPGDTVIECYNDVPPPYSSLGDFVNAGGTASDNCGIVDESFTLISEDINNTVPRVMIRIYEIADSCGNTGTCMMNLTINDSIPPHAVCNSIEVQLDSSGNLTLTRVELLTVASGSFDNCTPFVDLALEISPNTVNCSNIGVPVVVTLVVTDQMGFQSTCQTTVIVRDETAPVANCHDTIVYLDDRGNVKIDESMIDNGSYDNCGIYSMFIDRNRFSCDDVGDNTVTLTVVDNLANVATCTSTVTVLDTIPPDAYCQDIVLYIEGNDTIEITASEIDVGSFDVCGVDTMELSRYKFTCDDVGITPVTLYVTDVNGNQSECIANVTIIGNSPPVANNDIRYTVVNIPVDINIFENDYDENGRLDFETFILNNTLQHGTLTEGDSTGIFTYIPDLDFIGYDTMTYSICDDGIPCGVLCNSARVVFVVTPPNVPPVAVNDSFVAGCIAFTNTFIINDYDPDGDEIIATTTAIVNPQHGEVIIYPDGTFTYIHEPGFIGVDSFVYEICDYSDEMLALCDVATVKITVMIDHDCDGIPDIDDIDDDDDGILDVVEGDGRIDTDNDGIPDSLDIDSDGDGIADNVEGQGEGQGEYILPLNSDCDGDGWDDAYDPDCGGTEFNPVDTDNDGLPDYLDLDADNDNVPDYIEGHDANADGIPDVIPFGQDRDGDGLDDAYDSFDMVFGTLDTENAIGSNAPLQDFDFDLIRDWRDVDDDNDGFLTKNEDRNHDGNYANDDIDLDGHPEYLDLNNECELFVPEGFSPNGDGIHDYFEVYCIEGYPNAIMYIFDRDGHLLYQHDHYGNLEYWGSEDLAWWDGTSESRWVRQPGLLPPGNYIYVLVLGDGTEERGTVMISY
ncbi:MAG: gliding motility-associated C-terminal domain-containing protein, partial [Prolixibacteraceae bacterium]|nr:gliding motility-associated C-terminal domain-containing protein [Prolixibacteraceae bacterium]MBN2775499.1 gliding motility-associated C-terminal domain-containing protein [Prolixibacteraceae bacterium]